MQNLLNQFIKTIKKNYKLFIMLITLGIFIPFSIIYYQPGYKIYFNQIAIDNSHVKNYTSQLTNIIDSRHQLNLLGGMYQNVDKYDIQFYLRGIDNSFYYNKFAPLRHVINIFFNNMTRTENKNKLIDDITINYPSIKKVEIPGLERYSIDLYEPIYKVNVTGNLNKATNTKFINEYIKDMNSLFKVPQKEFEELITELKKTNSEIIKGLNNDLTEISGDKKLLDSILKDENIVIFRENNLALIKLLKTFKKYEIFYSDELIKTNHSNSNFDTDYYIPKNQDSLFNKRINILSDSDDFIHISEQERTVIRYHLFEKAQQYKNLTNFAIEKIKEELAAIEILDEFISSEKFFKQHDFFIFNSTQDEFFFEDEANLLFFIILVLYFFFGTFIFFIILSFRK
tara:strand:+ start:778 stop:1974 length:1197 start_codon:yes stop_codon:yes gene_type:complete